MTENDTQRPHARCDNIQCASCFPGWGARYNESIREAFERSSFGTPAAKAARESVSDEQVARVLKRAAELQEERDEANPTPEQWWCVDCGCAPEDHTLDGCGSCGDCYHPHMTRVIPPAEPCRECGPGYRIGDEGCRHAPLAEDDAGESGPERPRSRP